MRTIGSHHSAAMKSDTYLTPRAIIDALGPFDLDPCAAPEPRPWPTAAHHIARPDDGLAAEWGDAFVWLNPPYSREASRWLARLANHPGGGIALIFARTETTWFVDHVWRAERAAAVLWLFGRVTFCDRAGLPLSANSGAPSVLVGYGRKAAARLLAANLPGAFTAIGRAAA